MYSFFIDRVIETSGSLGEREMLEHEPQAIVFTAFSCPLQLLQLISVNTPAAAPNSITIIKNRENEGRVDGTCRVHIYILSNSA